MLKVGERHPGGRDAHRSRKCWTSGDEGGGGKLNYEETLMSLHLQKKGKKKKKKLYLNSPDIFF